jgi:hypothetical protein
MAKARRADQYSEEEAQRRFVATVRAALSTPPKPRKKSAQQLHVSCKADELLRFLKGLSADLSETSLEIVKRFIDLCDLAGEAALIDVDASSTSARKMIIRLKPSDRFRMLSAALRTGNFDGLVVEKTRHGASSSNL